MRDGLHTRIHRRLGDLGLDMKSASLAAGLNATFVRDLLNRNRSPNANAVIALAGALQVTPGWLLTGEGDETVDPELAELMQIYDRLPEKARKALLAAAEAFADRDSEQDA